MSVFRGNLNESIRQYEGTGAEWKLQPNLSTPFYDESYSVGVTNAWIELLERGVDRYEEDVEGFCTIIKFGDTMQLRETFLVLIETDL